MRAILRHQSLSLVLALTATFGLQSQARAQNQPRQTTPPQQQAPRPALDLKARDIGNDRTALVSQSLTITSLEIVVKIAGGLAQTTLTAQFSNPNERVLEGDFTLDLPREAYVTEFGLDVNGVMVDGVLQPKAKAAEAYEQNLRRGVDPGLGEINAANQFRTRIFPINPRSGRTVKITYVSALNANNEYVLPLSTAGNVGQVNLRVSNEGRARPAIAIPRGLQPVANSNFNTQSLSDGYGQTLGSYEGRNVQLRGDLKISNLGQDNDLTLAISKAGDQYFSFYVPPAPIAAAKPKTIAVYWDSSRSRRDDDLGKEIEFLERYLAQVQPDRLDLILFSDGTPRTVSFTRANMITVSAQLRTVRYQGASRLGGLERAVQGDTDLCLLFSDGQLSLDSFRVNQWPCRVMAISSSANARTDILEGIAGANRGSFIDLKTTGLPAGLAALQARGPDLRTLTTSIGEMVEYSASPSANGQFRITGPRPQGDNLIVKGYSGEKRLSLQNIVAVSHNGAAAFWGASQIKRLSATDNPDSDALLAAVRRFGVATPDFSYIVLETVEDYAINNIAPSTSLGKAFLTQYQARRSAIEAAETAQKAARFETIASKWTEQKTWWKTRFSPPDQSRVTPGNSNANAQDRRPSATGGAVRPRLTAARPNAAMPPPAPPPPPFAERRTSPSPIAARAEVAAESVVVTGAIRSQDASASTNAPSQSNDTQARPTISVTAASWNPSRPYLSALRDVKSGDEAAFEPIYIAQEARFGDTPAFYFDMAEWAFRNGLPLRAAGIARNAVELTSTSVDTKIILASRLERYGDYSNAIWLNERILQATPNKPQALRNLALALVSRADARPSRPNVPAPTSVADYERALELLMRIVLTPNAGDYDGIELIALMEANRLVPKLKSLGVTDARLAQLIDPRLMTLLSVDIRVTLEWNTDKTDMDLWVNEPTGEQAIYSNPRTAIGGRLSNDMTQGYGPEEYLLNVAPNGEYKVQANAFAADRLDPNGPTSLTVKLYRDWGRPTEKVESFVVELNRGQQQTVDVGRFSKGP